MLYSNERKFSKAVVAFLRNQSCFVQRIETGMTGRGVPDIYVASDGEQMWLELKCVPRFLGDSSFVPWRPGQQSWMNEHYRRLGKKRCFTLVAFADALVVLTHDKMYPDNCLPPQVDSFNSIHELFEFIDTLIREEELVQYGKFEPANYGYDKRRDTERNGKSRGLRNT